jgi:hypothetical protein
VGGEDELEDEVRIGYEEDQLRLDIERQRIVRVSYEDVCSRTGTWIGVEDLEDRGHYSVRPERLGPPMNEMEVIAWHAKTPEA